MAGQRRRRGSSLGDCAPFIADVTFALGTKGEDGADEASTTHAYRMGLRSAE